MQKLGDVSRCWLLVSSAIQKGSNVVGSSTGPWLKSFNERISRVVPGLWREDK
jgi:hypothetical protein